MPKAWSTETRAAATGRVLAGAWFLDLFCVDRETGDPATLRCWSQLFATEYDGEDYEGLGRQLQLPEEITSQLGSVAEAVSFTFDAGAILDNDSFMGRLADRAWHQRPIRVRHVLFNPDSNFVDAVGMDFDWIGIMDRGPVTHGVNAPAGRELVCEAGARRLRTANPHYRTPVNHARFAPDDPFYSHTATALRASLPWNTKQVAPNQSMR